MCPDPDLCWMGLVDSDEADRLPVSPLPGPVWTSLSAAPALLSLGSVGIEPVGEVMGATVRRVGWIAQFPRCGYSTVRRVVARLPAPVDHRAYTAALNGGYRAALDRMVSEAVELGADGVVGIATSETLHDSRTANITIQEVVMRGTAVRARSRTRPAQLFTTHLPGTQLAQLLTGGWVPVAMVFGVHAAVAHVDELAFTRANVELPACTGLVTAVRAAARRRFAHRIDQVNGDGAVVDSIDVRVGDVGAPYPQQHRDYLAVASVFGTALAAVPRSDGAAASRTLTVMPVGRPGPTSLRVARPH